MVLAYHICESGREMLLRQHDAIFICIETVAVIFNLSYIEGVGILPSFPTECFDVKATASILGLIVVFAATGAALGPFAGGRIFDLTGSYYYMVWLYIIASVVAIILGSLIKSPAR